MKKICLFVAGLYIGLFAGFAQNNTDSSKYKKHSLTFEEANLVSGYYHQDGNNSAVTGGTGTEKLTDISNTIELKLFRYDRSFRKHSFNLELGIDHYTSASSDLVDLKANSSASSADTRIYPSVNWTMENERSGLTTGAGLSFSNEFDYTSFGANVNLAKKTNDKSGEFLVKLQAFLDQVKLVYPTELRAGGSGEDDHYGSAARNSYSGSLSWSQIINQRFQMSVEGDLIYQQGYLSLPFHRVYLNDNTVHVENLPSTRIKLPLGIRANYFLGDKFILRAYYRYYSDNWAIHAHTASLEVSVKINPFLSVSPFYRYYIQTAADYFAGYKQHTDANQYYTSNHDLSAFSSNFYGAGLRITPQKGILGFHHLNMLEVRYGHYTKNIGMQSDIISLNLKYK